MNIKNNKNKYTLLALVCLILYTMLCVFALLQGINFSTALFLPMYISFGLTIFFIIKAF